LDYLFSIIKQKINRRKLFIPQTVIDRFLTPFRLKGKQCSYLYGIKRSLPTPSKEKLEKSKEEFFQRITKSYTLLDVASGVKKWDYDVPFLDTLPKIHLRDGNLSGSSACFEVPKSKGGYCVGLKNRVLKLKIITQPLAETCAKNRFLRFSNFRQPGDYEPISILNDLLCNQDRSYSLHQIIKKDVVIRSLSDTKINGKVISLAEPGFKCRTVVTFPSDIVYYESIIMKNFMDFFNKHPILKQYNKEHFIPLPAKSRLLNQYYKKVSRVFYYLSADLSDATDYMDRTHLNLIRSELGFPIFDIYVENRLMESGYPMGLGSTWCILHYMHWKICTFVEKKIFGRVLNLFRICGDDLCALWPLEAIELYRKCANSYFVLKRDKVVIHPEFYQFCENTYCGCDLVKSYKDYRYKTFYRPMITTVNKNSPSAPEFCWSGVSIPFRNFNLIRTYLHPRTAKRFGTYCYLPLWLGGLGWPAPYRAKFSNYYSKRVRQFIQEFKRLDLVQRSIKGFELSQWIRSGTRSSVPVKYQKIGIYSIVTIESIDYRCSFIKNEIFNTSFSDLMITLCSKRVFMKDSLDVTAKFVGLKLIKTKKTYPYPYNIELSELKPYEIYLYKLDNSSHIFNNPTVVDFLEQFPKTL